MTSPVRCATPLSSSRSSIHAFIVDPDASVARSVGALAAEVLPGEADTVVAKTTTREGAKALLERVQPDERALVIVVCASEFPDGGSGIEVLAHARAKHPAARVVLLTNGERDAFVAALTTGVDGLVVRPGPLAPLRSILEHLARGAPIPPGPALATERVEFRAAVAAMSLALEAVERARDALARTDDAHAREARKALREAELLALVAHRRMLEAEVRLGPRA